MSRPFGFAGSSYRCPACQKTVTRGGYRRLGPFSIHNDCRIDCDLCGKEILPPQIGSQHTVSAWLAKPVHTSCKENQ